ncbi:serine hydrolase [Dyadobacter psychrophilus]|uniref:CubicO group peptidase, beta-lactamase class C family n=1 Tax=Dyadobacter psychrophilus TaxID=651661 RepID=A0A1T5EBU7_9BACT|nr:serine hydrolase [Dyadobacter psychrophilus]SKB81472.1 CubicO group peptidase, beta-lactamase class C family [Dyadobacter psychrophilus]
MKPLLYSVALSLLLLQLLSPAFAQSTKLYARADSLFAEWNKPGSPGAAVGVVHQGKLIYAKGFGESDVETGAKNGPETIFHVASVSKQFTAYAIVLLAQQGKLSLDDDIHKHIPEVPDFGKTITIRHLIHHTSGLRDQWNLLSMAGWRLDDVITKEHAFNLIKRQKELNFEPGSAFAYCNTGYTILAEIVSRVGNKPFTEWMEQEVFKPLGMKNTLFYDNQEQIVKGRAYSFHKSQEKAGAFEKSILSYGNVGATSLFTTVNDLLFWIKNFRTSQIGGPAVMKQMLERGRLTKGDTLPYAFGLAHGTYKGLPYYGHNGADAGFRSSITYFPKEGYGFIVLSNQAEFSPEKKAFELAGIYMASLFKGEQNVAKKSPAKPVNENYKFDSTLFRNYAGAYELAEVPGFILNFRKEGERYFTQATGQPQAEIFPSSDTTFFLKVVEASVVFHKPKEGQVKKITLRQNGEHPANRVQPKQDSDIKKEDFAGQYYSPELETIYTISLKESKLKLIHVHHGEVDLNVVNKDRLNAPWWFVQNIDIVRGKSGEVTGLRMTNGRVVNLWFKKLAPNFAAD